MQRDGATQTDTDTLIRMTLALENMLDKKNPLLSLLLRRVVQKQEYYHKSGSYGHYDTAVTKLSLVTG